MPVIQCNLQSVLTEGAGQSGMRKTEGTGKIKPTVQNRTVIYAVFITGLLAAIALRAIIVANHIDPYWVRPLWYFAVLGNFIFFYFRFKISLKRKKAIEDFKLLEKVTSDTCLDDESKDVVIYLLNSIKKSPENLNYLILFIFSILAIALDIILSAML
jgi:hypothetical protein